MMGENKLYEEKLKGLLMIINHKNILLIIYYCLLINLVFNKVMETNENMVYFQW